MALVCRPEFLDIESEYNYNLKFLINNLAPKFSQSNGSKNKREYQKPATLPQPSSENLIKPSLTRENSSSVESLSTEELPRLNVKESVKLFYSKSMTNPGMLLFYLNALS